MVARARLAAAGVSARAARAGGFASVVLATDDAGASGDGVYTVDHDEPGTAFSLRERVLGLARELRADAVAVMGAGALPLLTAEDFAAVRKGLARGGTVAVTNNIYSARPDRVVAGGGGGAGRPVRTGQRPPPAAAGRGGVRGDGAAAVGADCPRSRHARGVGRAGAQRGDAAGPPRGIAAGGVAAAGALPRAHAAAVRRRRRDPAGGSSRERDVGPS